MFSKKERKPTIDEVIDARYTALKYAVEITRLINGDANTALSEAKKLEEYLISTNSSNKN